MVRWHTPLFLISVVSIIVSMLMVQGISTPARASVALRTTTTSLPTATATSLPSATPTTIPSVQDVYLPFMIYNIAFRHCDIMSDYPYPDLVGRDLSYCDLPDAYLFGAYMANVNLTGADLTGADLRYTTLTNANLTGAILTSADLYGADLTNANLTNAVLTYAVLTNAILIDTDLTGANGGSTSHTTNVTWNNTTCPDGTNSNNDGNTCVGHGF